MPVTFHHHSVAAAEPGKAIMPASQRGTTMLEVLIAILVLSFGLLGFAGLQAASLRYNQTAQLRSLAVQQAHDIASRMRANQRGAFQDFYALQQTYGAITTPAPPSTPCSDTVGGCTPQAMATLDIQQWNWTNSQILPGGKGAIAGNANVGFVVTIMWLESELDSQASAALQIDPQCQSKTPADNVRGLRCFNMSYMP